LSEQLSSFPILQHHIYNNVEVQAEYIKRILCSTAANMTAIFDIKSYKTIHESFETSKETGNEVFGSPY
jgi:hypothetical protein